MLTSLPESDTLAQECSGASALVLFRTAYFAVNRACDPYERRPVVETAWQARAAKAGRYQQRGWRCRRSAIEGPGVPAGSPRVGSGSRYPGRRADAGADPG